MIRTKKDLKLYLKEDLKQYNLPFSWRIGVLIGHEKSCAYHFLRTLRLYEFALNNSSGLGKIRLFFRKIQYTYISSKYRIFIMPNTMGYGIRISHFAGGIIINCKQMGNYCKITTGVVVGNKDNQENRAVIGDNVELTVGCKIIGKVQIGNNSIVAPNSVVIKDVPHNVIVSGIPARIIKI